MQTVRTSGELAAVLAAWQAAGLRIGFVPTMGALHAGHLSLVRRAREGGARPPHRIDRVVASVFVNPTQFGPDEDFGRYPRQPERDADLLASAGCDLLFLPEAATLYPHGAAGHTTFVDPQGAALGLEGAFRPGHFRGVATVVCALLNLVRADVAVFGEKDAQQLAVVRQMVADLHLPVEIVGAPTLREPDGLAMSSRNAYLGAAERQAATVLYRALTAAREAIAAGERRGDEIRRILLEGLAGEPLARVDYAEVVDAATFRPLSTLAGRVVLPLAVHIGATRLIDNFQLAVDGRGEV